MPSQSTNSTLEHKFGSVKSPDLPRNYDSLVQWRYRHADGVRAVADMATGERDTLEEARRQLGWPSILSLAVKWYPICPSRTVWKRALEKCRLDRITSARHTATLNLKYLLLAVLTKAQESLKASYGANRLLHSSNNKDTIDPYRLTSAPGETWPSRALVDLYGRLAWGVTAR